MNEHIEKRPLHLWLVGLISLIWNAFGAMDYVMTQTRNTEYLSRFTEAQLSYWQGFPYWMEAAWAFGVWGALIGSLLLLARRKWAVSAFALSLLGLLISSLYQFFLGPENALQFMGAAEIGISLFIWIMAIALYFYARQMAGRGVLR